MSFLRERAARNFFAGMVMFLVILAALDIGTELGQRAAVQEMMLSHDQAVVSFLVSQGVEEHVAAAAIMSTEGTRAGAEILGKLGINQDTDTRYLPFLSEFSRKTALTVCFRLLFLAVLLLTEVILFLYRRERLYEYAVKTVSDYTEGRFLGRLPRMKEGTLYHLFGSIGNMAEVLQAKQETEHQTKEFLKNTISDISHQLKTPLAALSMYNEIILDEPDNTGAVVLFAEKSNAAIERMMTLILSLLKITRLDAGGVDFEKASYQVSRIIGAAIENLTVRAEHEKKKIIVKGNPEDRIICDMNWTSEAIGNLVKNALDHTSKGGQIQIGWERTPAQIRILVSDNGSGILPDDFHHIFKRFYRSKVSTDTQGIGLGLPLARAVVEGQGGVLSVQSEWGKGTVFSIMFPYKTVS